MSEGNGFERALEAATAGMTAQRMAGPGPNPGIPFLIKPTGFEVHSLESLLPEPTCKRAKVSLATEDSFISYVSQHREATTAVFATVTSTGIGLEAILDYHGGKEGEAHWGRHRASFSAAATVEWLRWMAKDKVAMNQMEIAEFLEVNQLSIASPVGAEVLEMVQTLEGVKGAKFQNSQRLSNGKTVLNYEEEVVLAGSAGTQKGKVEFPQTLKVAIAPFKGGPGYEFPARLRYRIGDKGAISFAFETVDPHRVIEEAAKAIVAKVQAALKIEVFQGSVTI